MDLSKDRVFVVLLAQDRADHPRDRVLVGEEADDGGLGNLASRRHAIA